MKAHTPGIFSILGLLLAGATTTFAAPAAESREELLDAVRRAGGELTPDVRDAFFRHAEARVGRELAAVRVTLTDAQQAWLRGDPVLRDACYAAVYPPDPRIALNLLELRHQLGDALFAEYKQLLVAGAVARRFVGVGPGALGEKEEWALRGRAEAWEKSGRIQWPEYSVVTLARPADEPGPGGAAKAKEKKDAPRARVVEKRREKWENHLDKLTDAEGLDRIAAFLKEKNLTPRQLYESGALKKELLARMGDHAPDADRITHELLMKVMVRAGLRPASRDPFPSMAGFCRYLDGIKPRFPVKTAPWPLLMPLAKGWPLREAEDIWRRVADGGKLPAYGKYRGKELAILDDLEPFPWHWESWQGTYKAGGVCHEMSTIGLGACMSVGVPVTKAGQPHHSCILVYSHSPQGYFAGTKQGTKGPSETKSQWLFADPRVELPQVYHIGLALAMNAGLDTYLDTRIGVHLAGLLSAREPELAGAVLRSVARRNPYNTEVWARLCEARPPSVPAALHKAGLIQLATTLIAGSDDEVLAYREKAAEASLENETDEDFADANPRRWSSTYLHVLAKELLLPGLEPGKDPDANRRILGMLRTSAGHGIPLAGPLAEFRVAVEGWAALRRPALEAAARHVEAKGRADADELAALVRAIARRADDDGALLAWLLEMEETCDGRKVMKSGARGRKIHGDPLYGCVIDLLATRLEKAHRQPEAAQYRAKLQDAVESSAGGNRGANK
ncbi:MAG: hypothetical protein U1F77_20210 [Kiritimatiellia bacterium]